MPPKSTGHWRGIRRRTGKGAAGRPVEVLGPGGALAIRPDDQATRDLFMLVEGETSGRPLPEILAEFGCSRSAYYEKLRRFREAGLEGLLPRPPGPRSPWRRTRDVVRLIVLARLDDPARSPRAIAEDLRRQGYAVGIRSVERTLKEFGLTGRGR